MSVASGQVTFGSTGTQNILLGVQATEVDFFVSGSSAIGHADPGNQFAQSDGHTIVVGKSIVAYNSSGVKVLEFTVTAFNPTTVSFNVTIASASYPFQMVYHY